MIDRLEPRLQYANLAGYVYNDADQSKTFDANESNLAGTTVFLDANANGKFDSGETTTTADKNGYYQFTGLAKGDYVVGTTLSTTDYTSTTATPDGTRQGRFDITINGLENATPAVRAAFESAKARWEGIIQNDLPDVKLPNGNYYDDLTIDAKITTIDGVGNILGQAGPDGVRGADAGYLAYHGIMQFDSADLAQLQADNQLGEVILHEMGHVLGIGTVWVGQGLISGKNSKNPRFTGIHAVDEYNKIFDANNLSIPIESGGGDGTRNSHWKEDVLHEELMTGYIGYDVNGDGVFDSLDTDANGDPLKSPLSRITVGQMQDIGYDVNYDAADTWNPVTHVVHTAVGTDYGAVANERRITLAKKDDVTDLDFGYTAVSAPVIRSFSINPAPVAAGNNIVLKAASIYDADGDTLDGVTFYRESNGVAGLQKGSDTYISTKTVAKAKAFSVTTGTSGLSGDQVYYALATDSGGRSGRRVGVVTVADTTVPASTPTDLAIRVQSANSIRFSFTDPDTNVLGFKIQLATNRNFNANSLVYDFNIAGDSTSTDVNNLQEGITYYIRVRGYNLAGTTDYSQPLSFETA